MEGYVEGEASVTRITPKVDTISMARLSCDALIGNWKLPNNFLLIISSMSENLSDAKAVKRKICVKKRVKVRGTNKKKAIRSSREGKERKSDV